MKAREAKRLQEEARLRDLEKYQKKQKFNQTGYLKSILDPGFTPLLVYMFTFLFSCFYLPLLVFRISTLQKVKV